MTSALSSTRAVVLALTLAVAVVATACSSGSPYDRLPVPDVAPTVPTSTSLPPDYATVQLPMVPGTTTTVVPLAPGRARLAGVVIGPEGPVPAAVIHVERLVEDAVGSTRVIADPAGRWELPGVLGGRYRVRAWSAPELAMAAPEIFFLRGDENRELALRVDPYRGTKVDVVVVPNPPEVDQPTHLRVRVSSRLVDDDGIVRSVPQQGVEVRLAGSGRWTVESANPLVTGADGTVLFRAVCEEPGTQPLGVVLAGTDSLPLQVADCTRPPPATTTTTASTSTTSSSSTTSTSSTTTTTTRSQR